MTKETISIKKFHELSNRELYEIMRLRQDVFVIEQTCIYPDLDQLDYDCWHVLVTENSFCADCSHPGNDGERCCASSQPFRNGCDEPCCSRQIPTGEMEHNGTNNIGCAVYDTSIRSDFNEAGRIIGYLRILPAGLTFDTIAIGRVLVQEDCRRNGIARKLLKKALLFIREDLSEPVVKLSAQQYLIDFYKSLGFKIISDGYLEDGIPHIDMELA